MSDEGSHGGSLRELARQLGVTVQAVRKGIRSGRLNTSVGQTPAGKPCITDFSLAKAEWTRSSRTGHGATEPSAPKVAPVSPGQIPKVAAVDQVRSEPEDAEDVETLQDALHPGEALSASTLIEAQRLATLERAKKLRLENDIAEGRVVLREVVAREAFEAERIVREGCLNIPARIAADLAAEVDPAKVYLRLDAAIREALSATSDALLAAHA